MKKFLNLFKNRIVFFFVSILVLSLIPYFVLNFVSINTNRYSLSFSYDSKVDYNLLIEKEELESIKNDLIDYRQSVIDSGEKAPYSDFSYVDIDSLSSSIKINDDENTYTISVLQKSFNSSAQARRFIKALASNSNVIGNATISYVTDIITNNYIVPVNSLIYAIPSSIILITLIFVILYFTYPKFYNPEIDYDNNNIYRSVFHKSYWLSQFEWFHDIRKMILLAILFSLMKVVGLISLPSGFSNLGIGFSYLIFSVIGMLYGPINGLLIGALSDVVGFFMGTSGTVFHFGYTLNAMLAGFVYGICFYKTNITYSKCFIARLVVNLFVNVILGSIWWGQVAGLSIEATRTYMLFTSLPKNLVYLIPQSILIFFVIKALAHPLSTLNLISVDVEKNVRII